MANLAVQIFTFTGTETAAVDELITGMTAVAWTSVGDRVITAPRRTGGGNAVIRHTPLSAQDKVIHVPAASAAPEPITPGGNVYTKQEWTYAQSLAQYTNSTTGPVLVDMESFGIASTALALGRDLRVLALRVATDALGDKSGQSDPEQQRLLTAQLPALAAALARIIDFNG
jgi:nucleoside phosphorylase